ncbi:MAG TPA: TolC family protein [Terriglobia bacterium]|nr:TolC family protein [Terriglobia bacterium]
MNSVRILYYEVLGAEHRVQVQKQLAELSRRAVQISRELLNVGAADQPDLLESEIEAERAEVNVALAKTAQTRVWWELAAVVANPSLQQGPLEGNLEEVPRLELESASSKLFSESPEIFGTRKLLLRVKRLRFTGRRSRRFQISWLVVVYERIENSWKWAEGP